MYEQVEKSKKNKSQSLANTILRKQSTAKSPFQFVNNRSEGVAQGKLQEIANKRNAPIQLNGKKRTFTEAFGEDYTSEYEPPKKRRRLLGIHGTAESRIERMHQRGVARSLRNRIPKGRIQTPTGMVTISGLFGQRMTQSRKDDYGGQTFGSVPPYSNLQANLPDNALPTLRDKQAPVTLGLSDRERLASSLAFSLAHGSEEDRVPGTSAYFRAMAGDYLRTGGQGDHPLSVRLFPARSTAQEQRNLMEGRTPLNDQQRRALEDDPELSSDEEEDHFINR